MLSREQFERAVRSEGPGLLAWLTFLCRGHKQEAEDLLQKTFVDVWRARALYDGRPLSPWLRGFARNRLRVERRSSSRLLHLQQRYQREQPALHPPPPEPQTPPGLNTCLEKLPELDRQLMTLAYGLDSTTQALPKTDAEVASLLSTPSAPWRPERVKTRRHRALAALRLCLEQSEQPVPSQDLHLEERMEIQASSPHPPLLALLQHLDAADPDAVRPHPHLADCPPCQQAVEEVLLLELTLLEQGWQQSMPAELPLSLAQDLERRILQIPEQEEAEQLLRLSQLPPANQWPKSTSRAQAWRRAGLLLGGAAAGLLATLLFRPGADTPTVPVEQQTRGSVQPGPAIPLEVVIQDPARPHGERIVLLQQPDQTWVGQVSQQALLQFRLKPPAGTGSWSAEVVCEWPGRGPLPLDRAGTVRWLGSSTETAPQPIGQPLSLAALGIQPTERIRCTESFNDVRFRLELEVIP